MWCSNCLAGMFCAGNWTQNHRFLAIKIHPKDWDDIEGRNKQKKKPFQIPVGFPIKWFTRVKSGGLLFFGKNQVKVVCFSTKVVPKNGGWKTRFRLKKRSLFQGTMMNFRGVVPIGATSKHSNFNREILKGEKNPLDMLPSSTWPVFGPEYTPGGLFQASCVGSFCVIYEPPSTIDQLSTNHSPKQP